MMSYDKYERGRQHLNSVDAVNTHQYLDSSSCHPYHSKKSIPYSEALHLNRICFNNAFFDQRCNELEHWLHEWGYNERVVRQEILRAQKIPRNKLLEMERNHPEENKLTFNITYYPTFQKIKTILKELQILLVPDKEHQKVFPNVPIVGFRNGKSLKDHLVRASLPILHNTLSSESCGKRNCQKLTLIDQCTTNAEFSKREVYWQHGLKTFFQNGLNEREESCL